MVVSKYWDLTPEEFIRQLFCDTVDGEMTVTHYPMPCGEPYDSHYPITWSQSDVDELVGRYEALAQTISRIARLREQYQDESEMLALMSAGELEVWNTYIKPYDAYDEVDPEYLEQLYDMDCSGAQLNEQERDILERHYEWREEQCLRRLPYNHYSPLYLVERAMDYELSVRLGAHEVVLREYGRWLARSMVFYYYYDKSREKVFTLENFKNSKDN